MYAKAENESIHDVYLHNCKLMSDKQLIKDSNFYFSMYSTSKDDYWLDFVKIAEQELNKR